MKNPVYFLLGIVLFSCNPYKPYNNTHYYIQAELDPASALLSANVQMVFVARQEYSDSICFHLNPQLRIHTLAAQELEKFVFRESDSGRLVLFLEDPVSPNEQLQIALSYSGRLNPLGIMHLDSSQCWYPVNEDCHPCTYQAKFALPGPWRITYPGASVGKHGKWFIHTAEPRRAIEIGLSRD